LVKRTPTEQEPGTIEVLARRSIAYLTGGVAGKALALVTLPLLARLLAPAQLGLLDVAAALAASIGTLALAGMDNALPRVLPNAESSPRLWSSGLAIVAVLGVVLALVVLAFRKLLATFLVHDPAAANLFAVSAIYGLATAAFLVSLTVLRLRARARLYPLATTGTLVLQMVGAVVLAAWLEDPLPAILLWWALVTAVASAAILASVFPRFSMPSMTSVRQLAGFGFPFVPAAIAWTLGDLAIRSAISQADLADLGAYSIAVRLVSVLALVISAFSLAWMPYVFSLRSGSDVDRAFAASIPALLGILGTIAVGLTALAPEAVSIMGGDRYVGAVVVIAPLSAGMIAFGLFVLLSGASGLNFQTADVAWISVVGAVVQGILGWVLIPVLGLVGSGIASFVGYAIAFLLLTGRVRTKVGVATSRVVLTGCVITAGLLVAAQGQFLSAPLVVRLLLPVAVVLGILATNPALFLRRAPDAA
jgi:O-antigen/teichoic acid export membrane protein